MATLADELLNDFADSGSEDGGEQENGTLEHDAGTEAAPKNGIRDNVGDVEDNDGDEDMDEEDGASDNELEPAPSHLKMDTGEDAAETKARVERMQLHNVGDVRSVAGLMKQLAPVIEVSLSIPVELPWLLVVYNQSVQL